MIPPPMPQPYGMPYGMPQQQQYMGQEMTPEMMYAAANYGMMGGAWGMPGMDTSAATMLGMPGAYQ